MATKGRDQGKVFFAAEDEKLCAANLEQPVVHGCCNQVCAICFNENGTTVALRVDDQGLHQLALFVEYQEFGGSSAHVQVALVRGQQALHVETVIFRWLCHIFCVFH